MPKKGHEALTVKVMKSHFVLRFFRFAKDNLKEKFFASKSKCIVYWNKSFG